MTIEQMQKESLSAPAEKSDEIIADLSDEDFLNDVQENPQLSSLYQKVTSNIQNLLGDDFNKPEMQAKIKHTIRQSIEDTLEFSSMDLLTGLPNKLGFERDANRLLRLAKSLNLPAVLLSLDLDGFKEVNDNHGHNEGDNVLRRFGKVLADVTRDSDAKARPHGDEFWVLAVGSNWLAPIIAGRIRQEAPSTSPLSHVAATIGASFLAENDSLESLQERAEHALQWAKFEGKNRTVITLTDDQKFDVPNERTSTMKDVYVYKISKGKAPERRGR